MSTTEDRARAAMRAIAGTVHDAPPLQLAPAGNPAPAADEVRLGPRRPGGAGRQGRHHRDRRWRPWLAPLTSAAVVVVLAIALVLVKDITDGGAVPEKPIPSTGPGGVPRYYVALKLLAGETGSLQRKDIVVGDSLTGTTLATFASPADTAYESVTAAADDRRFVVFGVTSPNGSFDNLSAKGATGSWYEVLLDPGTADPARLIPLLIKPLTPASTGTEGSLALTEPSGSVLSGSGKELAVPEWVAPHGLTVRVFSVATGQLLHAWTTHDLSVVEEPSLAWIDGDRELALLSRSTSVPSNSKFAVDNATVREWPVAGPASGDLAADSRVVQNVQTVGSPSTTLQSCVEPLGGPVLISADGKTFSCTTAGGWGAVDHLSFHTYPLVASTTAATQGRIDYQVTFQNEGRYIPRVLWTSPSGDTLIGALLPYGGTPAAVANGLRIGVISHGKFTPLRIPASLAASTVTDIAF
jgi:hypothetical protein